MIMFQVDLPEKKREINADSCQLSERETKKNTYTSNRMKCLVFFSENGYHLSFEFHDDTTSNGLYSILQLI